MDLRQIATDSANVCLKYYEKHPNAAVFRTNIREIQETLLWEEFELTLEKKLYSTDGLSIHIGQEKSFNNEADEKHFYIRNIRSKRIVLSEVSDKLADALREHIARNNGKEIGCWFESDKTFLVKRVKEWYIKHGAKIRIPDAAATTPVSFHPRIRLSENQEEAVETALSSPFSYIWGAPGTGKTKHVLASCVYSCLEAGKKVLLTAPTNIALDQSLTGVLQALSGDDELQIRRRILRIGMPDDQYFDDLADVCAEAVFQRLMKEIQERIDEILKELPKLTDSKNIKSGKARGTDFYPGMTVQEIDHRIAQLNRESKDLRGKREEAGEKNSLQPFLDSFEVIAATVDSCIHVIQPDSAFKPDHIFLDEAGYCSMIKGMTYTAFSCPFTMLGDHMQLPPVCDVEPKAGDEITDGEKNTLFLWKFSAIAMEQIITAKEYGSFYGKDDIDPLFTRLKKSSLTETHRFGSKLAGILANNVYSSNFTSCADRETDIWVIDAPKRMEDTYKNPHNTRNYRFSQSEEDAIIRLVLNNIGSEAIKNTGILTPYKDYRKDLRTKIGNSLKSHSQSNMIRDNILSIHQSQGSEWNVVVVSVVDSMAYRDSWYMNTVKDQGVPYAIKIINTAISRTKGLLILVCDIASWQQYPNQFISKIIGIAEKHNAEDPLPNVIGKKAAEFSSP